MPTYSARGLNLLDVAVMAPVIAASAVLSPVVDEALQALGARAAPTTAVSDMTGAVVVVTGANCGIGFRTAAWIAKMGATVVLACRDPARAEAARAALEAERAAAALSSRFPHAAQGSFRVELLDLASPRSVRAFAAALPAQVDVLVNNAGLNSGPDIFDVNYLGHFLLTQLVLPALRRSARGGRVVNLSSVMHHFAQSRATPDYAQSVRGTYTAVQKRLLLDAQYADSKAAMVLLADEINRREPDVEAFAVSPGAVASDIWRSTPAVLRKLFLDPTMALLFLTPDQGAAPSVHAATAPSPEGHFFQPYRMPWGAAASPWLTTACEFLGAFGGGANPMLVRRPRNAEAAARDLWSLSDRLTRDVGGKDWSVIKRVLDDAVTARG